MARLVLDEAPSKKPQLVLDEPKARPSFFPSLWQESLVKPVKSFYGGTLKASAAFADTLDFYADKVMNKIGLPQATKGGIIEYLRDNWQYYGDKFQKEGVSNKLIKEVYSGLGKAFFDVPVKYMGPGKLLGPATLPTVGAIEGFREGGVKGAAGGAASGALYGGVLRGLGKLPTPLKIPTAFGIGAGTTPGGLEEKVASGAILAGLTAGKGPSAKQFKETQLKYSPLGKAYQKLLPFERRESAYQNFVNRFQSIENTVKKAKELGFKIKPGENPAIRARTYLGMGNKVRTTLENKTYRITPEGKIEITGEGLKPILDFYDKASPVKNRVLRGRELKSYLVSRRTIEDLQRPKGEFTQKQIVTPQQVTTAKNTLANLNKKYKGNVQHLEQAAQRFYGYQKRVLHLLVDSGNLSQEQYNTILSKNPNYVPFDRVIEGVELAGTLVSKRRFTGARAPIKRIRGSELEIQSPIENMVKNTYKIMDVAERNTVAKGVAQLGKVLPEDISPLKIRMQPIKVTKGEAGEAKTIFRPSQFKPKGNVIEYFENGKRQYIEVTPNLHQAMTGLNETSSSLMVKMLSKPAHWLRVGATITPEFMIRNPIRDQYTALMQTSFGFRPFLDPAGALADILGKSEAYQNWFRSGGSYSGFVELNRPRLTQAVKELQRRPNLLKKLNIITTAQDASQLFEQATRLGVYKAGIKKGLTPVEAGFQSREATVDFARRGAKTKDVNAVIAFFNAGIQGTDKSIRTAMADPAGFAAKGIASITIPSLLLYIKNRNDPDFKEIPRWQRDLFWVTKVGETYARIPKPFLYGQVFGSVLERFLEYLDTQDPQAFKQIEKSLYDALSPVPGDPMSGLLPTAIKPLIENTTNWNFFLERNIVPKGKERLLPQEQFGRYTSETAKAMGKLIKQSPKKIENLIQGYFGGTGRYALEGGDMLINSIKKATGQPIEPGRPKELADIPLVKGFVTRPVIGGQAESIQQFYNNREQINQAYTTYKKLLKDGRKEEAGQIKSQYPTFQYAPVLNSYADIFSKYNKRIDSIVQSSVFNEKQKRRMIADLDKKKVELAQKANKLIQRTLNKKKPRLVLDE